MGARHALPMAFGIGFLAQSLQVALFREGFALGLPGEIGLVFLMICWLGAGGLGSLAAARLPAAVRSPPVLAVLAVLGAHAGFMVTASMLSSGLPAGKAQLPVLPLVVATLAAVAPAPALFAAAMASLLGGEASPATRGRIYAGECAGAVLAGLVSGFVLLPGLSRVPPILVDGRWATLLPGAAKVRELELAESRLTLFMRAGALLVYENGRLAGSLPDREGERPLLLAGAAQVGRPGLRVLLPGSPHGAFLLGALEEGVASAALLVPSRAALDAVAASWPPLARALADPRVTVREVDARVALRTLPAGSIDLVLLPAAAPDTLARNRLFSREAFDEVRRLLAPGGALVFPLPAPGGGQRSLEGLRNRSVLEALEGAFPGGTATLGSGPLLAVAVRDAAPVVEAGALAARSPAARLDEEARGIFAMLADPGERAAGRRGLGDGRVGENRDHDPRAVHLTQWSRLLGGSSRPELGGLGLAVALALLFLLLLALGAAGTGDGGTALVGGAASMLGWSGAIQAFQVAAGALYQDLGLLTAASFLGSGLGSGLALPAWARPGRAAALAGLALGLATLAPPGRAAAGLALATAFLGGLAGGLTARALLARSQGGAGSCYGAELAGAAAGAVLAWLGTFPGVGLGGQALVLVALAWPLDRTR